MMGSRKFLRKIYLRKGNGGDVMEGNLRDLLGALWEVQDGNTVKGFQFETQKVRLRKHFDFLKERGCIEIIFEVGGRGRPGIAKIKLLSRTLITKKDAKASECKSPKKEGEHKLFKAPEGFELVHENELKELRQRAANGARDTRSEKEVALLFVDSANLTGQRQFVDGDRNSHGRRILPIEHMRWGVLLKTVAQGFRVPLDVRETYVYVSSNISDAFFVKSALHAYKCTPIFHHKDTDPLMSADIVGYGLRAMNSFKRITFVLITGDADYCRAIEHVKTIAREQGVSACFWVISWKHMTSIQLRKTVDWTSYIESIPNFCESIVYGAQKRPVTVLSR